MMVSTRMVVAGLPDAFWPSIGVDWLATKQARLRNESFGVATTAGLGLSVVEAVEWIIGLSFEGS
jgi:hypothetical protein